MSAPYRWQDDRPPDTRRNHPLNPKPQPAEEATR
jgi:hypothetical protein